MTISGFLVLYTSFLEFIVGFLRCLYVKVVAATNYVRRYDQKTNTLETSRLIFLIQLLFCYFNFAYFVYSLYQSSIYTSHRVQRIEKLNQNLSLYLLDSKWCRESLSINSKTFVKFFLLCISINTNTLDWKMAK